jgi:uncharacterized peroxidase-related enzyme
MRLDVLGHARSWPARAFVRVAETALRQRMDPVALAAMHAPDLWGRPFLALGSQVLRGPSFWTVGEREYLAMAVSTFNDCPFCVKVHTETTRIEATGEVRPDGASPMRAELAAMLPALERLTRSPDSFGPDDLEAVRAAGVPDQAVLDALRVCLVFNLVNRMANAFDWSWDSDEHARVAAKVIHRISYRLPGFTLR